MPAVPVLLSPANTATNQPIGLTFSWSAGNATPVTNYHLQLAANSNFSTLVINDSTLTGTSRWVYPVAYSYTYYWRVRAKNSSGASAWSNVWSYTTTSPPLEIPVPPLLASPSNGVEEQELALYLNWGPGNGTTVSSYALQVSTSSTFSSTTVNQTGIAGTSSWVSGLTWNQLYYWRVNATNASGTSTWSATWSFRTKPEPDIDPCYTYSSVGEMDQLLVTDASGDGQNLFVRNEGILLGEDIELANEMPPAPLQGIFHARFKSGRFVEAVGLTDDGKNSDDGKKTGKRVLAIEVQSAQFPLHLHWNAHSNRSKLNYWLLTPVSGQNGQGIVQYKRKHLKDPQGNKEISEPDLADGMILIEVQAASTPPPCDPTRTVMQRHDGDGQDVQSDDNGQGTQAQIPDQFRLGQNSPNPFNPTTTIRYQVAEDVLVSLKVYNTLGALVATLVDEHQSAGYKQVQFDGSSLPSGMYFYRLQAGQFSDTKKLLLVK